MFERRMVSKFVGTTCYLAWGGKWTPGAVYYVILLDPLNRGSRPLMGRVIDILRRQFDSPVKRFGKKRIKFKVVDLAQFQTEFPDYAVERI